METQHKRLILTILILLLIFTLAIWRLIYTIASPEEEIYPGAPSYTIWVKNSTYYAKAANGDIPGWGTDTNASKVIQNAIDHLPNNEGTVYIATGTYNITNTISLSSDQNLVGEGTGNTFLETSANNPIIQIVGTSHENEKFQITIRDLYLRGSNDASKTNQYGIWINYATGITVENVYIYRTYNGIGSGHSHVVLLRRVFLWECVNHGINAAGSGEWDIEQWQLTNVQIGHCGGAGIVMHYAMGIRLLGTIMTSNAHEGWVSTHTFQVMITEGDFDNNGYDNIKMGYDQHSGIVNSWIGAAGWSGIYLCDSSNGTKIIGNTVKINGYHGIYVKDSSLTVIDGNTVMDNSAYSANTFQGIYLNNVKNFIVSDTQSRNWQTPNQQWGIKDVNTPTDSRSIITGCITIGATGGICIVGQKVKVTMCWNGTSWIS
jgi:parallel beta-helix repeat protein